MTFSADLTGKSILITGASSGLGAFFARSLAEAKAQVILAARRRDKLADVAKAIAERGGDVRIVEMDVTDKASVERAIAEAGQIDVLVNNSGVTLAKPVLDQTEDDWDHVIDTNLKGAFLVSTAVARRMRDDGRGGSIINIASILGERQAGQVAGYATSKAGLIQLTKSMALELARFRIRVNALAPGYIDTDLNRSFLETDAGKALISRVPQRRLGSPEELIGPLLLLASDASSYMTGSVIAADGGHLCSTL
ncbi:glucose 1-dehydrogenase [Novosphingobium sp.]|uniref:SDR family NAD(P)-dependent oxidoreductase n=1 Tax=Novosphingobium sp. TaxID=1874826 RepID=UPI00286E1EAC|nr:glucose 1-dehydrogenase [Novosphingobium sp.]